jgi:hypothetical protein
MMVNTGQLALIEIRTPFLWQTPYVEIKFPLNSLSTIGGPTEVVIVANISPLFRLIVAE